jgi:hypothetical protein
MIGLEYHLPSEYFKYQKDCLLKTAGMLQQINHLAQARGVPIPPWDPWQYENSIDYVSAIQQEYPELLKEITGLRGLHTTSRT